MEDVEYIVNAETLQQAKLRFQERLLTTADPNKLREMFWPLLYGNEGAGFRTVMYGEEKKLS